MTVKRHHRHTSSTLNGSISYPLQKKHLGNIFSSPNRDRLKEALQSGGACEFDVKKGEPHEVTEQTMYSQYESSLSAEYHASGLLSHPCMQSQQTHLHQDGVRYQDSRAVLQQHQA